jgi:uncharacterized protein YijF (DUF1287 family)
MFHAATFLLLTALLASSKDPVSDFIQAARAQVGVTLYYDSRYHRLPYPNGDVPMDRGVCTDVVIRAYRRLGIDLQARVHEDMKANWDAYPKNWGMKGPDANIDHRRVPNLATFFTRHGKALLTGTDPKLYQPGDIVTWRLNSGVPHIGVVTDQRSPSGTPIMVHNIGYGAKLEDVLFTHVITGHYRYFPDTKTP